MRMCMKCGHVDRTEPTPEACPKCHTAYPRPTMSTPSTSRAARQTGEFASSTLRRGPSDEGGRRRQFLSAIRAQSHYPAFRAIVGLFHWLLIAVAVIALVSALLSGDGLAIAGALTGGAILVIVARVGRDVSLMMADLTDTTVWMAEQQQRRTTAEGFEGE